jgi:hypothetical protein
MQQKINIISSADKSFCREYRGRPFTKNELRGFIDKMTNAPTTMPQDLSRDPSGFPRLPAHERVRFITLHGMIRSLAYL